MASYAAVYYGNLNEETNQFSPTSYSIDDNTLYVIENGTYAINDPITVQVVVNDVVTSTIPVTIYGYSNYGWLGIGSGTNYFFSQNIELAYNVPIDLTTTGPFEVTCFLSGTLIETPAGQKAIEDLAIGDLVFTASGETRPVRWIGQQTAVRLFADPLRTYPIRFAAGALDDNVPARDLYVSPDHALLVDGLLVQANALINGITITRTVPTEERFTYFHIELEDHVLVLAEGTPAETFVDNVTRRRFDNYAEYEALYGAPDEPIIEIDLPRVKSARQLPAAIHARLQARALVIASMVA